MLVKAQRQKKEINKSVTSILFSLTLLSHCKNILPKTSSVSELVASKNMELFSKIIFETRSVSKRNIYSGFLKKASAMNASFVILTICEISLSEESDAIRHRSEDELIVTDNIF